MEIATSRRRLICSICVKVMALAATRESKQILRAFALPAPEKACMRNRKWATIEGSVSVASYRKSTGFSSRCGFIPEQLDACIAI